MHSSNFSNWRGTMEIQNKVVRYVHITSAKVEDKEPYPTYPVQSKYGIFGVRACPFLKQYSQPSLGEAAFCSPGVSVARDDNFAFKWTDLWELQDALKQSCVLTRSNLHQNQGIRLMARENKDLTIVIGRDSRLLAIHFFIQFTFTAVITFQIHLDLIHQTGGCSSPNILFSS